MTRRNVPENHSTTIANEAAIELRLPENTTKYHATANSVRYLSRQPLSFTKRRLAKSMSIPPHPVKWGLFIRTFQFSPVKGMSPNSPRVPGPPVTSSTIPAPRAIVTKVKISPAPNGYLSERRKNPQIPPKKATKSTNFPTSPRSRVFPRKRTETAAAKRGNPTWILFDRRTPITFLDKSAKPKSKIATLAM